MSTFEAVVLESVVETPDTRTLILDVGSPASYHAGQYVTIDPHQFAGLRGFVAHLEHLKGRREAPRAYSMSSAPHDSNRPPGRDSATLERKNNNGIVMLLLCPERKTHRRASRST